MTNFGIQKYYQKEPRFNGVYSRNNLPEKINDGAYGISLGEYAYIGTHWIDVSCNRSEIVCFDSFGVEHAPEEIFKKMSGIKTSKLTFFEYKQISQ